MEQLHPELTTLLPRWWGKLQNAESLEAQLGATLAGGL